LAAAVVVGAVYVGVKGAKRSAFVRWQPQVEQLLAGQDAYVLYGFPTPPIMAIILAAFYSLPTTVGMTAWLAFKVLLTLLALRWLVLQQREAWRDEPRWQVPTFALAAAATPIIADLMHGNINLWILFLVVASWRAFWLGKHGLAGLTLSLAIACKITPAVLLAYFAWKRAWKTTAAAVAGLALWLLLFPSIALGWERNLFLLERWSGLMLRPYVTEGKVERDVRNQSLAGLFQRVTSPPIRALNNETTEDDAYQVDPAVNVVSLTPDQSRLVWRMLVIAAVAGLWWITRRSFPQTDRRWAEHEFALVLLAMLLLSERSWKHHYVTTLPSFVALFAWLAHRPPNAFARNWVIALTAIAALLPVIASQDVLKPIAGNHAVELLQAYGVYVWSAVLLTAAHLIARRDLLGAHRSV